MSIDTMVSTGNNLLLCDRIGIDRPVTVIDITVDFDKETEYPLQLELQYTDDDFIEHENFISWFDLNGISITQRYFLKKID